MLSLLPDLPSEVFVGGQLQHVQGIAYDSEADCMYMSFTSRFVKVDMQGRILASIDRIQGHLGAMTFDPGSRRVYASLECKDDEIGTGIARTLGTDAVGRSDSHFYIAIIDVDKLTGPDTDPEGNPLFRTVCLNKVMEDYSAIVQTPEGPREHRYGCSGIDGVAIAPAAGKAGKIGKSDRAAGADKAGAKASGRAGRNCLYVAYGIYSDKSRNDNDYQVIHCYSLSVLDSCAETLRFGELHSSGPAKPSKEYFVYTGNTTYGVQNLAYDPYTRCLFLAAYPGRKPQFPNYKLFAVNLEERPFRAPLKGGDSKRVLQLSLSAEGALTDSGSGISGWYFPFGSTGLCALGDGLWYISENGKNDKGEFCRACLYRWVGRPDAAFEKCTEL